jgi:hypothetical protein
MLKFVFCGVEVDAKMQTFAASNSDSSPMAVQLTLTDVNM